MLCAHAIFVDIWLVSLDSFNAVEWTILNIDQAVFRHPCWYYAVVNNTIKLQGFIIR